MFPVLFFFIFLPVTIKELYDVYNPINFEAFIDPLTGSIFWSDFGSFIAVQAGIGIAIGLVAFFGSVSLMYFFIKDCKVKSVSDLFSFASSFYFRALGLAILVALLMIPLFLALIIPAIIFSVYWMFSQYFLIDEDEKIINSLRKSYHLVKGKWWFVAVRMMLLFLIFIGASIAVSLLSFVIIFIVQGMSVFTEGLSQNSVAFSSIVDNLFYIVMSLFSLIFITQFYKGLKEEKESMNAKPEVNETKESVKAKPSAQKKS